MGDQETPLFPSLCGSRDCHLPAEVNPGAISVAAWGTPGELLRSPSLSLSLQVPWDDLRYLFGEIMYGGHITDDWDRRLCRTYLSEYVQPEMLDGEVTLAPGFMIPPRMDYEVRNIAIHCRKPLLSVNVHSPRSSHQRQCRESVNPLGMHKIAAKVIPVVEMERKKTWLRHKLKKSFRVHRQVLQRAL